MIDFHCHIDLYPDPIKLISEIESLGAYVLSVTTTPSAFLGTQKMTRNSNRIQTALGLHPEVAHERHTELAIFDLLLGQAKYVGEIGLDGSPAYKEHAQVQERVFSHILKECARNGGRVMSIHSRAAAGRVINCLEAVPDCGIPVFHWFTGNFSELDRAIEMGAWFSVGPAMLRSSKGAALAARMPPDRILTETDGPFARIEGRSATPVDVAKAERALEAVWACGNGEVQARLLTNFRALCGRVDAQGRLNG